MLYVGEGQCLSLPQRRFRAPPPASSDLKKASGEEVKGLQGNLNRSSYFGKAGSWSGFVGPHTRKRSHCFPFLCVQGYGAYLALMMLKSTDSVFKCACAMSPVTDWKLYGESSGWIHAQRARLELQPTVGHSCSVSVLRAHLFSSPQHRPSPSDTSACLYGTTADTRCVFTADTPRVCHQSGRRFSALISRRWQRQRARSHAGGVFIGCSVSSSLMSSGLETWRR